MESCSGEGGHSLVHVARYWFFGDGIGGASGYL